MRIIFYTSPLKNIFLVSINMSLRINHSFIVYIIQPIYDAKANDKTGTVKDKCLLLFTFVWLLPFRNEGYDFRLGCGYLVSDLKATSVPHTNAKIIIINYFRTQLGKPIVKTKLYVCLYVISI